MTDAFIFFHDIKTGFLHCFFFVFGFSPVFVHFGHVFCGCCGHFCELWTLWTLECVFGQHLQSFTLGTNDHNVVKKDGNHSFCGSPLQVHSSIVTKRSSVVFVLCFVCGVVLFFGCLLSGSVFCLFVFFVLLFCSCVCCVVVFCVWFVSLAHALRALQWVEWRENGT